MSYKHILVPVDGSETSETAIEHAAQLAIKLDAKVTTIQVLVLDPYIASEYMTAGQTNELIERARTYIQKNLDAVKSKFKELGVEAESLLVEGQLIHREIIKVAEKSNVDLVVMGSHGRTGLKKLFLGSVAQNVLSEIHLPVLIARS